MTYRKSKELLKIGICLIFFCIGCGNPETKDSDFSSFANTVPNDYLQLLHINKCCDNHEKNIVFHKTTMNKYRKPISCFFFAKDYYLQVYMVDSLFTGSLKNVIKESYSDTNMYFYTTYLTDNITDMSFNYKHTKPEVPKRIFININGIDTKTEQKDDTTACYYSRCTNFWIKYNPKEVSDVFGNLKNSTQSPISLEILFLKRKNKLFLLMLSGVNSSISLNKGVLQSIVE